MDKMDRAKLKVLIKMILIQRSPKQLTANQLADIINKYDFAFRTSITSAVIGRLLSGELNKNQSHFMDMIKVKELGGIKKYYISSKS